MPIRIYIFGKKFHLNNDIKNCFCLFVNYILGLFTTFKSRKNYAYENGINYLTCY